MLSFEHSDDEKKLLHAVVYITYQFFIFIIQRRVGEINFMMFEFVQITCEVW